MFKSKREYLAIATICIKHNLLCPYDGQIFNPKTLRKDVQNLLDEYGYKMKIDIAIRKVELFSSRMYMRAYEK